MNATKPGVPLGTPGFRMMMIWGDYQVGVLGAISGFVEAL
jgi:hypothetical protein